MNGKSHCERFHSAVQPMICAILAVALLVPLCGNAGAQVPCGKHDEVIARLLVKYGESIVGRGISLQGSMTEILASEKGSWSVVVTAPAGLTCIVAAGENWEAYDLPLPGKGA